MSRTNPLARFGSDLLVYGSAVAVNAGVRFIILMVAARVLSTEDFGFLDNLLIIGIVVASIITMGCDSAIIRLVFDRNDQRYHGSLLITAYLIALSIAIFLVPLVAGARSWLDFEWYDQKQDPMLLLAMLVYAVSLTCYAINTSFMRALFLKQQFVIATSANLLLKVAPVLAVAVQGEVTLMSLFQTLTIGTIVATVTSFLLLKNYYRQVGPIAANFKPMLVYGVPLGLIVIAAGLQPAIERFQILRFADLETLGIYAAAAFPSLIIGIFIQVLNAAWIPYALKKHMEKDTDTFGVIFILCAALVSVIFISFALLADLIIELAVPIGNAAAAGLFPFIGLIVVIRCMSTFTSLGITIAKASHIKLFLYLAGIAGGALLSMTLFAHIGVIAVPLGFFCSNLVVWFGEALIARHLGGPRWPMLQVGLCMAAMIMVAIMLTLDAQFMNSGMPGPTSLIAGLAALAGVTGIGYWGYRDYASRLRQL